MESVEGTVKHIEFDRAELCKGCSGTGGATSRCPSCKGTGYFTVRRGNAHYTSVCSRCSGAGLWVTEPCRYLGGIIWT